MAGPSEQEPLPAGCPGGPLDIPALVGVVARQAGGCESQGDSDVGVYHWVSGWIS